MIKLTREAPDAFYVNIDHIVFLVEGTQCTFVYLMGNKVPSRVKESPDQVLRYIDEARRARSILVRGDY